jgi:hypothetical protein
MCIIKERLKYKYPVYKTPVNTTPTSRLIAVSFFLIVSGLFISILTILLCVPPSFPSVVPICFLLLFLCLSLFLPSFLGQIFLLFLALLPLTAFYYLFGLFLVIFLPSLSCFTHNCFLPYPLPFMTHKHVLAQTFALTCRLKASATHGSLSHHSWTLFVHTFKSINYILSHGLRS